MKNITAEDIAMVCHEANRAYCNLLGDTSQKPWDQAEQWQRDSAILGVGFRLANPDAPESAQHDAWMADKLAGGWRYGEAKDTEAKTHPCLVPYLELPVAQRLKDTLFVAVVDALKPQPEPLDGMGRIFAERVRQIKVKGFSVEHDARHGRGELALAGLAYLKGANFAIETGGVRHDPPICWPWKRSWWHPSGDPIRMLEKSGALYLAENERLAEAGGELSQTLIEEFQGRVRRCAQLIDELLALQGGTHGKDEGFVCECGQAPATHVDAEGAHLCDECWKALQEEARGEGEATAGTVQAEEAQLAAKMVAPEPEKEPDIPEGNVRVAEATEAQYMAGPINGGGLSQADIEHVADEMRAEVESTTADRNPDTEL